MAVVPKSDTVNALFYGKTRKKPHVEPTKTDRIAFDPDQGCANDLEWWAKLSFDGTALMIWTYTCYRVRYC